MGLSCVLNDVVGLCVNKTAACMLLLPGSNIITVTVLENVITVIVLEKN